jgi:TolA-binding protein
MISLKDYLFVVSEDATGDAAQLQAKISAIQARIDQTTGPLIRQKTQLTALLAQKQKQAAAEAGKNAQVAGAAPAPSTLQQPGSSHTAQPGGLPKGV